MTESYNPIPIEVVQKECYVDFKHELFKLPPAKLVQESSTSPSHNLDSPRSALEGAKKDTWITQARGALRRLNPTLLLRRRQVVYASDLQKPHKLFPR